MMNPTAPPTAAPTMMPVLLSEEDVLTAIWAVVGTFALAVVPAALAAAAMLL